MFHNYNYNNYRVFLQAENFNDVRCGWRTYLVSAPDGRVKSFVLENESINDGLEFRNRAHIVIEQMEKAIQGYNKEHKMTREDAIKIVMENKKNTPYEFESKRGYAKAYVTELEALGLLKFDEEILYLFNLAGNKSIIDERKNNEILNKYGHIKLELWSEGLVLWVGGEIVWKSWEKYYKNGDTVAINSVNSNHVIGIIK